MRTDPRPFVIIESPYRAPTARKLIMHMNYLNACMLHSLSLGEAPFASHKTYAELLNDRKPEEREQGMQAGWSLFLKADYVAVYTDLGYSEGMSWGIERAARLNLEIKRRKIGWP